MALEETDIISQLGRLTKHSMFIRSPRISNLLTYLVNEELAGRGENLKGYTVGVEALGKSADFDPSSDASVRVETGRLRRMLANYYSEAGDDPLHIEIPKGSYRPVFTEVSIEADPVLTLATTPSAGPSLAVLRFDTTTEDDQERVFAIGIREELLAELFQFKEFHYVDASGVDLQGQSPESVCRDELEAEFMLRGQIMTAGDKIVTSLSVTDLTNNRVIWVERFDNDIDCPNLIENTRKMAREVVHKLVKPAGVILVKALQKRMGVHPNNWTATDCILRWHYYRLLDRSPKVHAALREQIKRIIDVDMMFPLGKIIYAMLKIDEAVYALNATTDAHTAIARARYYVLQALSADPDIPYGHYVNAQCDYFDGDLDGFRHSIQAALTSNPRNSDLLHHAGVFLAMSGDHEQGLDLMEKAGMKYHNGVGYRLGHIFTAYFWGEPGEAKRLFETGMIPYQLSVGQMAGCLAYLAAGEFEKAAERYRKVHEIEGINSRSVENLVELWVKAPDLKHQIQSDFARLKSKTSNLIQLR